MAMIAPFRQSDYYQGVLHGIAADSPPKVSASILRALPPPTDDSSDIMRRVGITLSMPVVPASKHEVFVRWTDEYSVNDHVMDLRHQKIMELVNVAFEIKNGQQSTQLLPDIMQQLTEYALEHFNAEEELMERIGYPKLREHKRIHLRMSEQTYNMMLRVQTMDLLVEVDVFLFLKYWWLTHILRVHKLYGDYIGATGQKGH